MTQTFEKDLFTVTWRVENFSMCPHKKGEKLTSPAFVVDAFDKTRWELTLYSKGDASADDDDSVSCYLQRASKKDEPEEIIIRFNIAFFHVDLKPSKTSTGDGRVFKKSGRWGYKKIMSSKTLSNEKNAYLPNDILTIQCWMRHVSVEKESSAEKLENTSVKAPTSDTTFSTEEISSTVSDDSTTTENILSSCSLHTIIPVERRRITWTIKDFISKLKSKEGTRASAVSNFREKSQLHLHCYASGDRTSDGSVRIDIERKDMVLKETFVRCKVSVFYLRGVAQGSLEGEHLFGKNYEIWSFLPIIKLSTLENQKSILLHGDNLSLSFEFLVSYEGEERSTGGTCFETTKSIDSDDLRYKLGRLLTESEELSDVLLTAEGGQRSVHKVVICAQSPVFLAMFSGDTEEKRTGVVDITDMNSETLGNMVDFMYHDRLQDLDLENALNLYAAADKYQVTKLKEFCASTLKFDLSLSNVCDVLTLADMHQDPELMKYVETYLVVHAKDVFNSSVWEKLMKDNIHLAGKTMQKVIRKLTSS